MTDGENRQQARDAQRGNGQGADVEPHRVHLLAAERELLADCHRCRTYPTVCREMVSVSELPSSLCEAGCERMITYCVACLDDAAKCNADAGLVWSPPGPWLTVGDDR